MRQLNQSGFSLVELLVATALGLVVLATSIPVFLSMLTQQRQAQDRLEAIEAARFASQIISQHIRDASAIRGNSHATLLEVDMPPLPASHQFISYACVRSGDGQRIQLEFHTNTAALRCKNPLSGGSFQTLIDHVWDMEFSYSCPRQHLRAGTMPPQPNTQAASLCAQCPQGIEAVTTTLTSPTQDGAPPVRIRWTTTNRQAYWHATSCAPS